MRTKKIKARYQISTAVKEDILRRIEALRARGWTIPALLLVGITEAEKQEYKKEGK